MKFTVVAYYENYCSVEVEANNLDEVEALFDAKADELFEGADAVNQGPWNLDSITTEENGETVFY